MTIQLCNGKKKENTESKMNVNSNGEYATESWK